MSDIPFTEVVVTRVADPQQFNADPDPSFHFNAGPDPTSHFDADPRCDANLR
jgi:hypothetical protein